MRLKPKIAVIGCGAAGIAAATRLLEQGFNDIILLEAENRIGGRIHSLNFGGYTVELGAQWCHGEKGNIAYELVKDLHLLSTSYNNYLDNTFYTSSGEIVDKKITDELFLIGWQIINDEELVGNFTKTKSFGHYFISRYDRMVKNKFCNEKVLAVSKLMLDWWHKFFLCLDSSKSWYDVSVKGAFMFEECEGDFQLQWGKHGFKTLLDVLMKKYPNPNRKAPIDNKIELNKEVTQIMWNNNEEITKNNVSVKCKDGSVYNVDHLIVTVSLGVLKRHHNTLFKPPLPLRKVDAIEGLTIGTVCKIFIKFPKKWWPEDFKGFSFLWNDENRKELLDIFPEGPCVDGKSWLEDVFGFYRIDSHPNVLLGWLVGKNAEAVEKLCDNEVLEGCMYLLKKFVGWKYEISEPDGILRSKWGTHPHFYGCYSTTSLESDKRNVSFETLAEPLCVNNVFRVLFAGEATHPFYFSTVHGAIETGFREADRIINLYGGCSKL